MISNYVVTSEKSVNLKSVHLKSVRKSNDIGTGGNHESDPQSSTRLFTHFKY